MAPGFAGADLFRMIGSFVLVLAIMGALLWTLKKLQHRMTQTQSGRRLQIVESLSVGTRQKIALLRVGSHEVLVGITATQINPLAHWPEGAGLASTALQAELTELSDSLTVTGGSHAA